MDNTQTHALVEKAWSGSILAELIDYIRIPNKSPAFDPHWQQHGYMEEAIAQFERWARIQAIEGMTVEVVRLSGRTPLLFINIPGSSQEGVLLYGHLDKQPEMTDWRSGLGPWEPVLEGDRLYGRGAADDGYALFAALTAMVALKAQRLPHARCVVIIEACEESGSLHSGDASGIVPSSFRILRQILSHLEDEHTGHILPQAFQVNIPPERQQQARIAAETLASAVFTKFPWQKGATPLSRDPYELILNRTWRPALSIVGAGGLPLPENAGNVLRPWTSVKLSLRLPPTCDAKLASSKLKTLLEEDPPYGARISFVPDWAATGWNAPELAPWLETSIDKASRSYF